MRGVHETAAKRKNNIVQTTLSGIKLRLPKVRTSDGHILEWDREAIVRQLLRETELSEKFYGIPPIDEQTAREIAAKAEKRILAMGVTKNLSSALIREIVNMILLEEYGATEWKNICTRVGTPVYDAHLIDIGEGFEAKENANLQENAETSHKKKADKICKEQYLLLMPQHIADAHLSGDIHIHDLEYFGTRPFCMDHDLRYFFYYGLMPDGTGVKASVAGPAKKPEVAVLHAVKVLGAAQTNCAGGQGYFNFLTFLAPYFEGLSYEEIKQLMQMFVFEMTQMQVARGGQLVFSSVQLTPGVPKIWRDKPVVYKGHVWDGKQAPLRTYGEFEREVRLAFKALMEVMLEGDYWGKPFNFPKPEISLKKDFLEPDEWVREFDEKHPELPTYDELYDLAFELAAKFGTPYFDNEMPEYRGGGEGVSCYQCCAYNFVTSPDDKDFLDKVYFRNGKHFSMGAWQVVTINCPRAAYRAEHDDELLFKELKRMMDLAVEVFKVKRQWMEYIIKNNRMPFLTQRPKDPVTGEKGEVATYLDELVYIIGVVGINDMVQYHIGKQMHESEEALRLAVRAMTEMELYAKELCRRHNMNIRLARTPAESCAQRFAVADLLHEEFREKAKKVVKGDVEKALAMMDETRDLPVYYTNGTHVPPSADIPLTERIRIEHIFFPIVDGGNIFHIFMGESYPDPKGIKSLAMKIAKNTQIGYFAFTKDLTVCMDDFHVAAGLHEKCPNCGSENVDHLSRITGYIQAVSGWNEGKKQELLDRKRYSAADVR